MIALAIPAERRAAVNAAMAEVKASFESQARRTAARIIKSRARDYIRRPQDLNVIWPSLSVATASRTLNVGCGLLAIERETARRHMGFGAEVMAINARAIILIGRLRRRKDHAAGIGR